MAASSQISPASPLPRPGHRTSDLTIQVLVVWGLLIALVILTGLIDRKFYDSGSLRSVARDAAIASILALGQAVVIIGGGIDLSIGSLVAFCGTITLLLMRGEHPWSLPAAAAVACGAAACVGLAHGLLICRLRLQPFLVTLCSLLIFRGLSRVLSGESTVNYFVDQHPLLYALGGAGGRGIPQPVFVVIAVLVPLAIFLHCTVPGRYLFALGDNLEAARFSGIRVNTLRVLSYVTCSLLTALAALLEAGHVGSVTPSTAGNAYEMYAITAAVLGGCALGGGQGSLLGAVAGATILRVLESTVIFVNLSGEWKFVVTGLVLLAAVIADALVKRRRQSH